MRNATRLFSVLVVLVGVAAVWGFAQSSTVEQEILKLERTYDDAFLKKDRAALEGLFTDDFVYIHSNGTATNRTQELAEAMSTDTKWTASTLDSLRVRVYGDVAVVTGVQTLTGRQKGTSAALAVTRICGFDGTDDGKLSAASRRLRPSSWRGGRHEVDSPRRRCAGVRVGGVRARSRE